LLSWFIWFFFCRNGVCSWLVRDSAFKIEYVSLDPVKRAVVTHIKTSRIRLWLSCLTCLLKNLDFLRPRRFWCFWDNRLLYDFCFFNKFLFNFLILRFRCFNCFWLFYLFCYFLFVKKLKFRFFNFSKHFWLFQ
jgi:hypothetical protein